MTADERALLDAVIAAPGDDLPRLVYADWLDEQGRAERAAFIRVQCELARQSRHSGEKRHSLVSRERELFSSDSHLLLLEEFHRGFIQPGTVLPDSVNVLLDLIDSNSKLRVIRFGGVSAASQGQEGLALPAKHFNIAEGSDRLAFNCITTLTIRPEGAQDYNASLRAIFDHLHRLPYGIVVDVSGYDIDEGVANALAEAMVLGGRMRVTGYDAYSTMSMAVYHARQERHTSNL